MTRKELTDELNRRTELIPELKDLQTGHFRNVVVGGGPAGYAVASTLLDGNSHPTLWIDPVFQAGRLAYYLEVRVSDAAPAFVEIPFLLPMRITCTHREIGEIYNAALLMHKLPARQTFPAEVKDGLDQCNNSS